MDLNKLAKEAYENAKAHGWHEEEHSDEHYLMLIITEIAEAVQADRNERYVGDIENYKDYEERMSFQDMFDRFIEGFLEDELSDIVIRCLDLAGLRNISLQQPTRTTTNAVIDMTFSEFCFNTCHIISMGNVTLEERLEAVIGRILFYCDVKDIDIEWFIEQKMKYNRLRPYRHGDKKY